MPWSTVGIDITADPTLDEVLTVRAENSAYLLAALEGLTDDDLATVHDAIAEPGYPSGPHSLRSVGDCLRGRFNEEWWHHQYALRDLATLEGRSPSA